MKILTLEEQKAALEEEITKTAKEVFLMGKQMEHYATLSALGKHSQRYLSMAAQAKSIIDDRTELCAKYERDLTKVDEELNAKK